MLTPVEPRIRIVLANRQAGDAPGQWLVSWQIWNDGPQPLALDEAWIPHGKFRGDGHVTLSQQVAPGASVPLTLRVAASEAPGTVVENTFLILRVSSAGKTTRIFSRMRIEFDADGMPLPVVETVTGQSVK
jgi:hypothetical protein